LRSFFPSNPPPTPAVEPWGAIVVGTVAGLLYLCGSALLIRFRLDDAVDAIPVHMINGMWGLLSVGFLASPRQLELAFGREVEHPGWVYSWDDGRLLAAQIVGMLFVMSWTFGTMMPFFIWLDWKGWFRSDPLEEIVGLDTSYHGGLIMLGGEESVNPEYISQFKKQRDELKNRRTSRMIVSDDDNEGDYEATTEPE
jgi:ammonia channel protein AmtB